MKKQAKVPEARLSSHSDTQMRPNSRSYLPGGAVYKDMTQNKCPSANPRGTKTALQWLDEWDNKWQQADEKVVEHEQNGRT